jgi:hypothetical protein
MIPPENVTAHLNRFETQAHGLPENQLKGASKNDLDLFAVSPESGEGSTKNGNSRRTG